MTRSNSTEQQAVRQRARTQALATKDSTRTRRERRAQPGRRRLRWTPTPPAKPNFRRGVIRAKPRS